MFRTAKLGSLGLICVLLSLPSGAFAGHNHPGYDHAADDLRLVRALLQRPNAAQPANGWQDEVSLTIGHIDMAVKEIEEGVSAGQTKPHNLPRIDPHMTWAERLDQSLRLLERAEWDCTKEKDDAASAGLKGRIFDLLDQAHTRLSVAIQTVNFDYSARNIPTRND
jgi:ketosteroid isomerase-like protein